MTVAVEYVWSLGQRDPYRLRVQRVTAHQTDGFLICTAPCDDAVAALGGLRFGTLAPGRCATASPPPACHSSCGTCVLCIDALRFQAPFVGPLRFCRPTKGHYADRETKTRSSGDGATRFSTAVPRQPFTAQLLPPLRISARPAVLPALRSPAVRKLRGRLRANLHPSPKHRKNAVAKSGPTVASTQSPMLLRS